MRLNSSRAISTGFVRRPEAPRAAPPVAESQPNQYVSNLGPQAQTASWVDQQMGNRDGVLSASELVSFANAYGHDARYHHDIKQMALRMGLISVQSGGRVWIQTFQNSNITINVGPARVRHNPVVVRSAGIEQTEGWRIASRMVRGVGSARQNDINFIATLLAKMPLSILRQLENRRYRIDVAGTISEARPELRGVRPRGFPPGQTWDHAAGCHTRGHIVLSASQNGINARCLYHEVAHAFEDTGRQGATYGEFPRFYNADLPALRRNGETYITQPGNAGLSEGFAESFARYLNDPGTLQWRYPNLHAYWKWHHDNNWREL